MKNRKFTMAILSLLLVAGLVIGVSSNARAIVDGIGLFELDGNPLDDAATGDDAENVALDNDSALASIHIPDVYGNFKEDAFTEGSSDEQPVEDWVWDNLGTTNSKGDIENAFAAVYPYHFANSRPGGKAQDVLVLYFGADRESNNGDSGIGFWFFQDSIVAQNGGVFSGYHKHGDLLIESHFVNGGTQSEIDVYTWNDPTPLDPTNGDGTLDLIKSGAACDPADTTRMSAPSPMRSMSMPRVLHGNTYPLRVQLVSIRLTLILKVG